MQPQHIDPSLVIVGLFVLVVLYLIFSHHSVTKTLQKPTVSPPTTPSPPAEKPPEGKPSPPKDGGENKQGHELPKQGQNKPSQ